MNRFTLKGMSDWDELRRMPIWYSLADDSDVGWLHRGFNAAI